MPAPALRRLLSAARDLREVAHRPDTRLPVLRGRTIATLFFEDSTRTRLSFALAAERLSAGVVDLAAGASSVNKGESLVDTARSVAALGVSLLVVRHRGAGAPSIVARGVREWGLPVVNAGDGRREHPTQGLLDALVVAEAHGRLDGFDLSGLTYLIVGDVVSSRVARSDIAGLTALGARVVCVGPPNLCPASIASLGCRVARDLDEELPRADAVQVLRMQFERHAEGAPSGGVTPAAAPAPAIASVREHRALYALTRERARRLKPGAIVMHPGPMNRGLEIDGEVADGPASRVTRQVAAGVAVRMAVLADLLAGGG